MKKDVTFKIKKLAARALVGVGAALGLTACFHRPPVGPIETVYGPPPGNDTPIEIIEDVYGPPVEFPDTVAPDAEEPTEPQKPAP